jgi:hypothetical protein
MLEGISGQFIFVGFIFSFFLIKSLLIFFPDILSEHQSLAKPSSNGDFNLITSLSSI